MGELLRDTERANTAKDKKAEYAGSIPPPTLAELGITKRESRSGCFPCRHSPTRFAAQ